MLQVLRILLALIWLVSALRAAQDWPDFRGPMGDGHASDTEKLGVPLEWDEATHKNIAWKTAIHDEGHSSPVVIGQGVWLTTATTDGKKMYAVRADLVTGAITHDLLVFQNAKVEGMTNRFNNYAAPSPVVEPGHVYVHFGTYGTACLDSATGQVQWQRRDLNCLHMEGPGSSPILYRDLLILTLDGTDKQFIVALDKRTGKTVWQTARSTHWDDLRPDGKPKAGGDYHKAFSTPLVAQVAGRDVLISLAAKNIFGYEPLTGRELWSYEHGGFSNGARPVVADGLVYLSSGFHKTRIIALRIDAATSGALSDADMAWENRRHAPIKPSPLLLGDDLYEVDDSGFMSCLDRKTGKEHWVERLSVGKCSASPLYVDGKIYVVGEKGITAVIEPGPTLKKLAENHLEEGCTASPAVVDSALILRTDHALYRIETAKR